MSRTRIENMEFSLLYDYDRDNLKRLDDNGKIEWFKQRMDFVFIHPVKALWTLDSDAYKTINTPDVAGIEHRGFNLLLFCAVLSGVESFGAFLRGITSRERDNKRNFAEYLKEYMQGWHVNLHLNGNQKPMVDLLWKNCRNAIAHGFRITEIGINHTLKNSAGEEVNFGSVDGIPMINCVKFFNDFVVSTRQFYRDLDDGQQVRQNFIKTFNAFYS